MVFDGPPLPNDPGQCEALAEYFEAQARNLRAHADRIREGQIIFIRRQRDLVTAGREAMALIDAGASESRAVATVAAAMQMPTNHVLTNLKSALQMAKEKARADALARASKLRQEGASLRTIADQTGLPRSTLAEALKSQPAPPGGRLSSGKRRLEPRRPRRRISAAV